jgi:hypothetical protein
LKISLVCSLKTPRKCLNRETMKCFQPKQELQIALTFAGILFSLHIASIF